MEIDFNNKQYSTRLLLFRLAREWILQ